MDVQGPAVVRPYTEKFGVTFPVAVDTADVFGRAFGLKAIPVSYLVDEVGIVRLQGSGPSRSFLEQVEEVLAEPMAEVRAVAPRLEAAWTEAELEERMRRAPEDWRARLALARLLDERGEHVEAVAQLEAALEVRPQDPGLLFTLGLVRLHQGRKPEALEALKKARDADPDNWRIRKQIWALENPDRFYEGESPDYDWQKEELARERKVE